MTSFARQNSPLLIPFFCKWELENVQTLKCFHNSALFIQLHVIFVVLKVFPSCYRCLNISGYISSRSTVLNVETLDLHNYHNYSLNGSTIGDQNRFVFSNLISNLPPVVSTPRIFPFSRIQFHFDNLLYFFECTMLSFSFDK